jgi:phospholipid-transporting ATPase
MTVVVRDVDGRIRLFTKGADSQILALCAPPPAPVPAADGSGAVLTTPEWRRFELTKHHVTQFALKGSRTLVMASRELTEAQYQEWSAVYRRASTALDDRELKIEHAFSLIERDLILSGCTAVDDQLQEHVPSTVRHLLEAGLKIIMLTGDKQETAVSIGTQSGLMK